jgi:osmotically-inducible protein OsmY
MKVQEFGIILAFATLAIGCTNSGEGTKDSLRDNSIKASAKLKEGFDDGANMAKKAGAEIGAAAQLTPRIKTAITADPKLNADGNLIDVDSRTEKVTLSGHVLSQGLKDLAGKIAKEEMVKAKAQQKFSNDLEIKPAAK